MPLSRQTSPVLVKKERNKPFPSFLAYFCVVFVDFVVLAEFVDFAEPVDFVAVVDLLFVAVEAFLAADGFFAGCASWGADSA